MDNQNKGKKFMIISICILILSIAGSSYAYYENVLFDDTNGINVNTSTKGLDYYIEYTKNTNNITNGTLNPSTDHTGGNSVSVTFYKNSNTYDIYGHIYMDVSQIGDRIRNSSAVKYEVYESGNSIPISSGTLQNVTSGSSILLKSNISLTTTLTTYTIYLWLDDALIEDYDMEGEVIEATIRCEATMELMANP